MTYSDLLRDPRWQRKRLEKLQEADWQCAKCFSREKTLNVHHKKYRHGAMPWEYEMKELEVLCEDCHESIHHHRRLLRDLINDLSPTVVAATLGYALANHQNQNPKPVDVREWSVAKGVADAVGVAFVGESDAKGGPEWVQSQSDEHGNVLPKKLSDELSEWWCAAGNALEERKRKGE
jgi:hypothetical protein